MSASWSCGLAGPVQHPYPGSAPSFAPDALPWMAPVGDRHGPARVIEFLRVGKGLTDHRLGQHRSQEERVVVHNAVLECHVADPQGALACHVISAVIDLPAEPVQRSETPRRVEEV